MTHAVIETGGKQYRVAEGDVLTIERLPKEKDATSLTFTPLWSENDAVKKVTASVIGEGRDPKKVGIKYKAKSRYRVKFGHRQGHLKIKIDTIA